MKKTTAVLLCSGTSSRMKPLSDKFLFKYLGKTILEHQINMIQNSGIEKIFFVGNASNLPKIKKLCKEKIKDSEKNFSFFEQKILKDGMKGGVLSVENFFPENENMLIVSSNDIVENWFYKDFLEQVRSSQSEVFLCGKTVENYFPGGYLELKSEKFVKKIVEKPGEGNEPSNMINLVIHLFTNPQRLFETLQKQDNKTDDAYELALQSMFDEGIESEVVSYAGEWKCLKFPWHHLEMNEFFLQKISKTNTQKISKDAYISEKASITGNVIIEEGVKIFDFAVVSGPVYIGKNSIIGNHCLVRESHIGQDCCIGQGTEVARSYIRNNVFTHQSYIGDSVIDSNVNFGAGCRTGNLRHDGKNISVFVKNQNIDSGKQKLGIFCGSNVKMGINTSFFPGITIGKNSQLFPHLLIEKNTPDNSFIKANSKTNILDIRANRDI